MGAVDPGAKPFEHPQSSRRMLITFGVLGVVLAGAIGIWFAYPRLMPPSHQAASLQPAPMQRTSVPPAPAPSAPAPAQPAPLQPAPVQHEATVAPIQPTPSVVAPPPRTDIGTPPAPVPDAASIEVAFWNSIKDEKNPSLFEAYLKRYPNGAFADIARITLDELKTAARTPAAPAPQADDLVQISDPVLLKELRDRLYELNFDPGPPDGPLTDASRKAIQEFQQQINVPPTGIATMACCGGCASWAASNRWGRSASPQGA